ncbi:MAG: hypothetical protein IPP74_13965 [Alphaproteobacteria bacterium]|nr:hypothetical protein [Alphaproteobacteria bacterium]
MKLCAMLLGVFSLVMGAVFPCEAMITSRTCKVSRDRQFNISDYKTPAGIRSGILSYYPIGDMADCAAYIFIKNDLRLDVTVRPEPIDMALQKIIRLHYKKGLLNPKEYWVEISRRLMPSRDEQGKDITLLTNEIEDIRIREVTEQEKQERKQFLDQAPIFNIDKYKSDAEAQAAFLELHPIGSPAHLAHYTLMKAGGRPYVTIHGDHLNEYGTKEIIGYRFKRGVLGWGGYRVQIYRKTDHENTTNIIEKINIYKTYQGL